MQDVSSRLQEQRPLYSSDTFGVASSDSFCPDNASVSMDFSLIERKKRLSFRGKDDSQPITDGVDNWKLKVSLVDHQDSDGYSAGKDETDYSTMLLELPDESKEVLKAVSCLGSLNEVVSASCFSMETSHLLDDSVEKGSLVLDEKRGYRFVHNHVQSAVYYKLFRDDKERSLLHLALGRRLVQNLTIQQIENNYFTVLSQFHHGKSEIQDGTERNAVASLCLQAGKKAMAMSDFCAACNYLEFGIELMGTDWKAEEYEFRVALYNAAAEVEYCMGHYERTDELVAEIIQNSRCYRDTLHARSTRVFSLGSRYRKGDALKEGLDVLRSLGQRFPSHPRKIHVVLEFLRTRRLLQGKSNEMILRMPLMKDPDKLATVHMLNLLLLNAYQTNPNLYVLLVMQLLRLTVKHGLSAVSSAGFSVYGTMVCSLSKDKDEGYNYGRLSLDLLDKFQAVQWIPRTYVCVYGNTHTYKHPLQELIPHLHHASRVGLESGDIEYAMLASNIYTLYKISSGYKLAEIEAEAMVFFDEMVEHQQDAALLLMRPGLQLIQNLMGKSEDPLRLNGEMWSDTSDVLSIMESRDELSVGFYHFHRVMLAYIFEKFDKAEKEAKHLETLINPPYLHPGLAFPVLFRGLAAVAASYGRRGLRNRQLLATAKRCCRKLDAFAQHSPKNCLHKMLLLEAELAAVKGKHDLASRKFRYAISCATQVDDLVVLSVACERAARFMRIRGNEDSATSYLRQAHVSYTNWGAAAKAEDLACASPELFSGKDNTT